MNAPVIGIVIPTFNREATLPATLESIKAQQDGRWECLLVDDGSSDSTLDILKSAAEEDPRFRWTERKADRAKGANACRNIGAEMAYADWVFFLDSDDLLTPDCVGNRIAEGQARENWDYLVFTTEHRRTDESTGRTFNRDPKSENRTNYLGLFLTDKVPWHTTSPLWNRSAFLRLGGFDEHLQRHQDADLHVRALFQDLAFERIHGPADNVWLIGAEHKTRGFEWFRKKLVSTFAYLEITGELLNASEQKAELMPHWRYFWYRVFKDNFCWHPGQLRPEEARFWELAARFDVFEPEHKRALKSAQRWVLFRLKTGKRWMVKQERKADLMFETPLAQHA